MSGDPAEHGPYSVSLSGQARRNMQLNAARNVWLSLARRAVFTLTFRAARGLRYGTQPSGFPGDERQVAQS